MATQIMSPITTMRGPENILHVHLTCVLIWKLLPRNVPQVEHVKHLCFWGVFTGIGGIKLFKCAVAISVLKFFACQALHGAPFNVPSDGHRSTDFARICRIASNPAGSLCFYWLKSWITYWETRELNCCQRPIGLRQHSVHVHVHVV